MTEYHTIVFQENFTTRKYDGWACLEDIAGTQHLHRRQGIFDRHLLLFRGGSVKEIQARLEEKGVMLRDASELRVYVNPAPEGLPETIRVRSGELRAAPGNARMFNTYTFVHDLSLSENELWEAFHSLAKRQCRQAEQEGVTAQIIERPPAEFLDRFLGHYREMAAQRSLRMPDRPTLNRMVADGNLLGVETRKGGEFAGAMLLVYLCPPQGIYLHGVSAAGEKKKFNQLLQWEVMKYLKVKGYTWYDLGGVPSLDKENGIYRFKQSLGGKLVGPAAEYLYHSPGYKLAKWLRDRLR